MTPERRHLAALDGVRGLAILVVFVHHVVVRDRSPLIDGGWVGVDLFFVLSGFLITTSMIQRPELGGFLRRRFWRIAPVMAVFLLAYVVWSIGADDAGQRHEWAFAAATQWANVQGAIGPPFSPHIGHLWSLSAEAQFYVVWGVALWWLLRRGTSRAVVLAAVVVLFAASWVERVVLWDGGTPWNRLYLGPDTRAAALLVGCALGLAFAWGWLPSRRLFAVLVAPALVFAAWFVVEMSFLDGRTYRWALGGVSVAFGVLVASAVAGPPVPLRVVLELRPLAWLGRVSYSVYLWHLPVIAEVARRRPDDPLGVAVLAVPITLVVATASYVLVERPFLRGLPRSVRPG